ncbi:FAD-linked oxidase C-terminal domain-containing protein [Micromonospora sp. DT178]|uniref:FAD-linked oxidase C-terminal domain-containing protein n=1 Tax=Micromonospora sp. DT178 TaxID=3393436 RepID=UPI003CF05658
MYDGWLTGGAVVEGAEHGLGQSKRGIIADYNDSQELHLMRGLKQLLDPRRPMNPGRVLPG